MTAGPRASASGERHIIAREIEANRPRRLAARFTKAQPAEAARHAFVRVRIRLAGTGITLTVDHSRFEETITPIFDRL